MSLTQEPKRKTFDIQIYSSRAYFTRERLVLEDFFEESIFFETRTGHSRGQRYSTFIFPTRQVVADWYRLFPRSSAQPNSVINGFNEKGERKVLFSALSNPKIWGKKIYFDFNLDQIEFNFEINHDRILWKNKREKIFDVSILIDPETEVAPDVNIGIPTLPESPPIINELPTLDTALGEIQRDPVEIPEGVEGSFQLTYDDLSNSETFTNWIKETFPYLEKEYDFISVTPAGFLVEVDGKEVVEDSNYVRENFSPSEYSNILKNNQLFVIKYEASGKTYEEPPKTVNDLIKFLDFYQTKDEIANETVKITQGIKGVPPLQYSDLSNPDVLIGWTKEAFPFLGSKYPDLSIDPNGYIQYNPETREYEPISEQYIQQNYQPKNYSKILKGQQSFVFRIETPEGPKNIEASSFEDLFNQFDVINEELEYSQKIGPAVENAIDEAINVIGDDVLKGTIDLTYEQLLTPSKFKLWLLRSPKIFQKLYTFFGGTNFVPILSTVRTLTDLNGSPISVEDAYAKYGNSDTYYNMFKDTAVFDVTFKTFEGKYLKTSGKFEDLFNILKNPSISDFENLPQYEYYNKIFKNWDANVSEEKIADILNNPFSGIANPV